MIIKKNNENMCDKRRIESSYQPKLKTTIVTNNHHA